MSSPNLISLLPTYFKTVKDFIALMETEDIELEQFDNYMQLVYHNFFIQTADKLTIAYHEALLHILVQPGETLEFRRMRVLNRYNNRTPLTLVTLKEKLNILIGVGKYELYVDYANYNLYLTINAGEFGIMDEMVNTLVYMIPAHIGANIVHQMFINTLAETKVAMAYSHAMKYRLTQSVSLQIRTHSDSKVAAAYSPASRYQLTQDFSATYKPKASADVDEVVNAGNKYRLT